MMDPAVLEDGEAYDGDVDALCELGERHCLARTPLTAMRAGVHDRAGTIPDKGEQGEPAWNRVSASSR
jgi:hypothetical protein